MKYVLKLDEVIDKLFNELERMSSGKNGHECVMVANDSNCAAMQISRALVPFFERELKEVKE